MYRAGSLWIVTLVWLLPASGLSAAEDLLMRAVVNGRKTSLFEKVVVTSGKAVLASEPGGPGEPIEPFAIFFRLLGPRGTTETDGWLRVGTSTGDPLGWLRKSDVTSWSTRFVLEPLQPIPGREFTVNLEGDTAAKLNIVPEGKRRFALITSSDTASPGAETGQFQVVVYAGNVQSLGTGGTIAKERNQLRDLKLEVVFVLESTDFMLIKIDGLTLFDVIRGVTSRVADLINADPRLKGAVRLGLVEFQDNTSEASFVSRVTCPLTDDLATFTSRLATVQPKKINGDWPDNAMAGLVTAIGDGMQWTENSSKHVILLGMASMQLASKGQQPSQFGGDWNFLTRDRKDYGWNDTGVASLSQLIARANPQGGSTADRARQSKLFHAILASKAPPRVRPDVEKAINEIVHSNDAVLAAFYSDLMKEGVTPQDFASLFSYYLIHYQRRLATSQYEQLARNDGVQGLNFFIPTDREAMSSAGDRIATTLSDAFSKLAGVREGTVSIGNLQQQSNEMTQSFYAIVGAAAEKFKDQPVLSGSAGVRDGRGREVAQRKVLVSRVELQRLHSTLDAIHKKFQAKTAKADRQDVGRILDELKQITAQTGAGQTTFAEDVRIKDVVSDLPLRTAALDTTPRDLAVMPSDAFQQWLNRLEAAIFRADDLLGGKAQWLELSSKAQNEKFTFLHVSELP